MLKLKMTLGYSAKRLRVYHARKVVKSWRLGAAFVVTLAALAVGGCGSATGEWFGLVIGRASGAYRLQSRCRAQGRADSCLARQLGAQRQAARNSPAGRKAFE